MNEQILQFGTGKELMGVFTRPCDTQKNASTALLLLNAGLLHRVGFNRFNTDLARQLVKYGFSSLRFDLHGLGDSTKFNGKGSYDTQTLIDITDAIDILLEKSNAEKCILVGLCSGADIAHVVAVNDPRVGGVVFLDGYAFPTLGFYLYDYGPSLFNPYKITKFIFKKIAATIPSKKNKTTDVNENLKTAIYTREFPSRKKITSEVQQLIDRGTELYYIYSGGVPVYYNYEGQFRAMFRKVQFKNKVSYNFLKEADHTYTLLNPRQKLMTLITEWMKKKF
jgi:pimeloyl-ACP methyl ester carboxylesterase